LRNVIAQIAVVMHWSLSEIKAMPYSELKAYYEIAEQVVKPKKNRRKAK